MLQTVKKLRQSTKYTYVQQKTLIIKFPPPRDGKGVKCPGYARGGGGGAHAEASI